MSAYLLFVLLCLLLEVPLTPAGPIPAPAYSNRTALDARDAPWDDHLNNNYPWGNRPAPVTIRQRCQLSERTGLMYFDWMVYGLPSDFPKSRVVLPQQVQDPKCQKLAVEHFKWKKHLSVYYVHQTRAFCLTTKFFPPSRDDAENCMQQAVRKFVPHLHIKSERDRGPGAAEGWPNDCGEECEYFWRKQEALWKRDNTTERRS